MFWRKKEEDKKEYKIFKRELTIGMVRSGLFYGVVIKADRKAELDDTSIITDFIDWYKNGNSPMHIIKYSNGDEIGVTREHVVGYRVTNSVYYSDEPVGNDQ